jgi:hypothetical protein
VEEFLATQPEEVFEERQNDDKKTKRGRFWRGLALSLLLACRMRWRLRDVD